VIIKKGSPRSEGMTQAVECLICKLKVLSSNTSSTQKGKERRGGLVGGEQEVPDNRHSRPVQQSKQGLRAPGEGHQGCRKYNRKIS
jgi:hypothetical protein